MLERYKGVAIGGPKDGEFIEHGASKMRVAVMPENLPLLQPDPSVAEYVQVEYVHVEPCFWVSEKMSALKTTADVVDFLAGFYASRIAIEKAR